MVPADNAVEKNAYTAQDKAQLLVIYSVYWKSDLKEISTAPAFHSDLKFLFVLFRYYANKKF